MPDLSKLGKKPRPKPSRRRFANRLRPFEKFGLAKREDLVSIRVFMVDASSPAYKECYGKTNRRVKVDFNSLDLLVGFS